MLLQYFQKSVARVDSLKIVGLGVAFSRNLSASQHIGNILKSCSQSLYFLRLLRAHGMCETAIQTILGESLLLNSPMQPVLGEDLPKLLTGNELMLSFAGLNDVDTTHVHLPMFEELYENTDDQLFNKTVENSNHVLHTVLPQPSVAS